MWIYLLKNKTEVFTKFKRFNQLVEIFWMCIKILITNGGGEYTSTEFAKFCEEEWVKHEVIVPDTRQRNGISLRKNESILNMARNMLKAKQMLNHFLGEATSTTVHIINKCPTKKLNNKTPYETWYGLKPSVGLFNIFGSKCYRHVPEKLRRNLDDRCLAMILVGYHSTIAYKLLSPNKTRWRLVHIWNLMKVKDETSLRL